MRPRIWGAALLLLFFSACKRETEIFETETIADYVPIAIGKSITYQLDSFVYTNGGTTMERHTYQEKNVVEGVFKDNEGRDSYRVFRSLRDSAGKEPWHSAGTYFITPLQNRVEVVDNNLRTIRLSLPFTEGTSWKGNTYLPDDPYEPPYDFSKDNLMKDWDFTLYGPAPEKINAFNFDAVWTVQHADDGANLQNDFEVAVDTTEGGSRAHSVDKYAKGVGLVYQELVLWEHQTGREEDYSRTPAVVTFSPYYIGFGVRRSIIAYE